MDTTKVYLVQTDTTVGFLSNNDKKLSSIKKRPHTQKILQALDSFTTLKTKTRVPNLHKRLVRAGKLTTFIYPNGDSYRVVNKASAHHNFVKKFHSIYSTSANETTKKFDFHFACEKADIIVFTQGDFFEHNSSSIIKLTNFRKKRIR